MATKRRCSASAEGAGCDRLHTVAYNYRANSSAYSYDTSGYTTFTYQPIYKVGVIPYSSPAGSMVSNGYGLYDMAGNMFEWCWDQYGDYTAGAQTDPRGASSGSIRVYRGGSSNDYAFYCRAACREGDYSHFSFYGLGFRVARSAVP
jgi:hypothetical protein